MQFEEDVCESLGLQATPGSGNQWTQRGDSAGALRVSAKSTAKRSWAETRRQLKEAIEMAAGTDELAALAIEDEDGARLVLMRLEDLAALRASGGLPARQSKRGEIIKETAKVPFLLREEN